ncbi:DUF6247 family protein [Sphaerimonospora cavernae]|uniref:DUF6247 family protein n=1 Tax=Sphaerimonospora cavernae TaxID=1740611 RepID=A0ABV6U1B1_9ACTN
MSAQPVHDLRYSPKAILQSLPEQYRQEFLTQYWKALEDAREPGEYHRVHDVLHLWWLSSLALADPDYEASLQEVLNGIAITVPIEAAIPDYEERLARVRAA